MLWTPALIGALSLAAGAPADWIPPGFEQASVAMLAPRLEALGAARASHGSAEDAALASARAVTARIDKWGEARVLKSAPGFKSIQLPRAPHPSLDAMARYFTCIGVYEVMTERDAFATRPTPERLTAAKATFGFTVATLFLRHHYLRATGAADESVEAFLTSPEMEPILAHLQADAKLLDITYGECRPVASSLVD
jgi:hypothetical protein